MSSALNMSPAPTLTSAPAPNRFISDEARLAAIRARDRAADGHFFYSVKTTGVFCRPSCAARPALASNIAFHLSVEDARAAGFRPCKRCRPDQIDQMDATLAKIQQACRIIDETESPPSLNDLADQVGLSPFHFHRLFKAAIGITPKAYADARRAQKMRDELAKANTITTAIYDSGFNSSGRFYAQADSILGMAPRQYRKGGHNATIRFAIGQTSLGLVLVAMTEKGVCAILLGDDPIALADDLERRFPKAKLVADDSDYAQTIAAVINMVETPAKRPDLALDISGTAFQQKVWQALQAIPAGETRSYADIAAAIDAPKSARAVAQACANNHLAIIIPCHRVVRGDGALSGYRWGVDRKRALLEREGLGTA
jgi:AraC family transcriptional regulator of adaptative response/methylated-DNA-[protein]-cysteine methyltransferase